MKKLLLIPLVVLVVTGLILGGCAKPAPAPAPTINPPEPSPVPPEVILPESPPYWAASIRGSTTLEEFGTEHWSSTCPEKFGANRGCSEYFYFPSIAEDRYTEELIVLFRVTSDTLNFYAEREPGHIFFELTPCSGQGLWEFSPKKLLCPVSRELTWHFRELNK